MPFTSIKRISCLLKKNYLDPLLRNLLNKLKSKSSSFDIDQNTLKQSRFFIKSLTWGLIATTGLSISWLALAYTDEVVFVEGKLEPIGEIKIFSHYLSLTLPTYLH